MKATLQLQHKMVLSSSILSLYADSEHIIALTNCYMVAIFDRYTFELVESIAISSKLEQQHMYEKSCVVGSGKRLFVSLPKSGKGFLLLYYDKKLGKLSDITMHETTLSAAAFSYDQRLLATGDEAGKLYVYHISFKRVLFAFPGESDYVSAISFSKDDRLLAASYFNKKTVIYDFDKERIVVEFSTQDVVERSCFSDDCSKFIGIERDKKLFVYDLKERTLTLGEFEFESWPTAIVMLNSRYCVVGTKGDKLYLVDICNLVIKTVFTMQNTGISSIFLKGNHLFVGFIDGTIYVIDIAYKLDEFLLALKLEEFEKASSLVLQNSFLLIEPQIAIYDQKWPEVVQKAKELINDGKTKDAQAVVSPFFIDPLKEEEFMFCMGHIQEFVQFKNLVSSKLLPQAYRMAAVKPFLQKTAEYALLESMWLKAIHQAKMLFALGDSASLNKAKELLSVYVNVQLKKELVVSMLSNHQVFVQAEKLIKERKFAEYFLLTQKYGFLKDEELYKKVVQIGHQTLTKLKMQEQSGNIDEALKIGEFLKAFTPLADSIGAAIEQLKIKKILIEEIAKNNICGVYEIVSAHPFVETFEQFVAYHRNFLRLKNEAQAVAVTADAKGAYRLLEPYMAISYCFGAVAKTMRIGYIKEMERALQEDGKSRFNWSAILKRYVDIYGADEEILSIAKLVGVEDSRISNDKYALKNDKICVDLPQSILQ